MSDFSRLTAAPWKVAAWPEYLGGVDSRTVIGPNGEDIIDKGNDGCASDPCPDYTIVGKDDADFIALARNFADVCERNGWSVRRTPNSALIGWVLIDYLNNTLAGPFNTVYEAWQGAVDYDVKLKEKA